MKMKRSCGDDEEKTCDSSCGDEEPAAAAVVLHKVGDNTPYFENDDMKPSSPGKKDLSSSNNKVSVKSDTARTEAEYSMASSSTRKDQDDQLESAKVHMGEVREENQRLKMYLKRMMKDYEELKMQFYNVVGQDSKKTLATPNIDHQEQQAEEEGKEEPELVSLTLGRFSCDSKRDDKGKACSSSHGKEEERGNEGLSLSLDKKFEASNMSEVDDEPLPNPSPVNTSQEPKEEETWPPSKALKTTKSGGDDEVLQQNPAKRTRVSVRTRCDTATMNDGCQWRKYGQKIAKGNPCPRAYYRCTVAPSCPVRKQVQRCVEDRSILITTYEGNHNHPLPMSATAMASTTCAAASMISAGSTLSAGSNVPLSTSSHPALHGLNVYLSDNSKSKFYWPNTSLSSALSHPTITLDLTSTPSSFPFNRFYSAYPTTSRYNTPTTSLSFGSSEPNMVSWGSGLLTYCGSSTQRQQQPYMKSHDGALNMTGRVPQPTIENSIYQSFIQKNHHQRQPQQPLPDTIAAATKAITTDPNFQSALAVALASVIGAGNNGGGSIGCGSSFFNKAPSTGSQPGSSIFLPPTAALPFSTPKSASTSPSDTENHSY